MRAWLSSACGAPKSAINPSPPSLLTMPRLRRTAVRIAISAGSSREIASSGSSSEIRSVERCRSTQRTVRYLRSPDGGLDAPDGRPGTTAPQEEQYKSPTFGVDRQTWQNTLSFLHQQDQISERRWQNKRLSRPLQTGASDRRRTA